MTDEKKALGVAVLALQHIAQPRFHDAETELLLREEIARGALKLIEHIETAGRRRVWRIEDGT